VGVSGHGVHDEGDTVADPEQLDALLELSDEDSSLLRLRRRLDDLPEQQQLDEAVHRRTTLEQALGDRRLDRDRVQARLDREDREVAQLKERLGAEQQRMYGGEISNARELASMRAEIEAVERRIGEHEDAELEAMEELDQIDGQIADLEQQVQDADAAIEQRTVERDQAAQTLLVEIADLEVAIEQQRQPLPDDLLERYDRARERFGGRAVGRLDGDQCTACGISLSYADVNELVEGPPLATCPNCGRMMVVS
jgi:uncharacterized protein